MRTRLTQCDLPTSQARKTGTFESAIEPDKQRTRQGLSQVNFQGPGASILAALPSWRLPNLGKSTSAWLRAFCAREKRPAPAFPGMLASHATLQTSPLRTWQVARVDRVNTCKTRHREPMWATPRPRCACCWRHRDRPAVSINKVGWLLYSF